MSVWECRRDALFLQAAGLCRSFWMEGGAAAGFFMRVNGAEMMNKGKYGFRKMSKEVLRKSKQPI